MVLFDFAQELLDAVVKLGTIAFDRGRNTGRALKRQSAIQLSEEPGLGLAFSDINAEISFWHATL